MSGHSLPALGPDLDGLVRDVGVPLTRAVRITGLPSRVLTHATFRLEFSDGLRLKGRRLDAPGDAERVATLVAACVEVPALQRVLARRGVALLEEWVEGVPLDRRHPTPELLERAGALLGAIHRAAAPVLSWPPAPPSPAQHLAATDQRLDELMGIGLLSPAVADRLRDVARAHAPDRQEVGIVHRDFCSENLVLGPDGTPHVVDNGTLAVDAYDFDLARTWYRWPMTRVARQAFEAGYTTRRGLETYRAHFRFWAIAVLTEAALWRHRAKTRGRGAPLRRLLDFLSALDRDAG